jgi:hypothetical protein
MGTKGIPTVPLLIDQGADGTLDGSAADTPGIGPGDGVMVTGDVRTLAREYCGRGVPVQYNEEDLLDHVGTAATWIVDAANWVTARFAGLRIPQDCAQIPPGNFLAPISGAPPSP